MIHRLRPQSSLPSSAAGATVKGQEVSVAGVSVAQVPVCTMPAPQSYYFWKLHWSLHIFGPSLKSLAFCPFATYYIGSIRRQDEFPQTQVYALHKGLPWYTGNSERKSASYKTFLKKKEVLWLRREHGKITPLHRLQDCFLFVLYIREATICPPHTPPELFRNIVKQRPPVWESRCQGHKTDEHVIWSQKDLDLNPCTAMWKLLDPGQEIHLPQAIIKPFSFLRLFWGLIKWH